MKCQMCGGTLEAEAKHCQKCGMPAPTGPAGDQATLVGAPPPPHDPAAGQSTLVGAPLVSSDPAVDQPTIVASPPPFGSPPPVGYRPVDALRSDPPLPRAAGSTTPPPHGLALVRSSSYTPPPGNLPPPVPPPGRPSEYGGQPVPPPPGGYVPPPGGGYGGGGGGYVPGYAQPGGPAYAGFGIRLIAYIIDAVLATSLGFVVFFVFFVPFVALGVGSSDEEFGSLLAGLGFCFGYCGLFAASLGYFTVTWGLWSTSPGKMLFGLRIVDGSGQRLGWSKAILRTLGYFCSGLIFYIGFLLIAFDERKQGLHDKIADTFVVQR